MRKKLLGVALFVFVTALAMLVERLTRPELVDEAGS